jgi:streptogramin lyase
LLLLGLSVITYAQPTVTRYSYENTSGGLGSNRVYAVAIQPGTSGRVIWFGFRDYTHTGTGTTYEGGMSRLELDSWGTPSWTLFTPLNSSLPDDFIYDLEFDADGNLWIASYEGGVARLDASALASDPGTTGWTVYDASNTQLGTGDRTYEISIAPDGSLWFGHTQGDFNASIGLSIFDGTSQWLTLTSTNSPLLENKVVGIAFTPDSTAWIGHKLEGVVALDYNGTPFDGSDDTGASHAFGQDSRGNNIIINAGATAAHPNGDVWIGHGAEDGITSGSGVSRYIASSGTWTRYDPLIRMLDADSIVARIRAIVIDSYGVVWLGDKGGNNEGSSGLWRFDPRVDTEPLSAYRQPDDEEKNDSDDNYINEIAIDEENQVIWLATDFVSAELTNQSEVNGVVKIEGLWEPIDTSTSAIGDQNGLPAGFALAQNYPNPFNPVTLIEYSLDRAQHIELAVYDITGKLVRTLDQGYRNAGSYSVTWDGEADNGLTVSSGIYFYRLESEGGRQLLKKAVYLK